MRHMTDQRKMFLILVPVLAANALCGLDMHRLSAQREIIKQDYSQINSIRYGLLSVDSWEERLQVVLAKRIDDFELSKAQENVLRGEISKTLNALISEAERMIEKRQSTFSGKVRKLAIRTFVSVDDIRKQVPVFTQAILTGLQKPGQKRKFKKIALSGLDHYAAQTHDHPEDTKHHLGLLARYQAVSVEDFNLAAGRRIGALESDINAYSVIMLGSALIFLFAWGLARGKPELHKSLFSLSTAFAFILLAVGLALPMIDLDARIKSVDFLLWGEHLKFHDQVLFFRSKSILQVVKVLMDTGKADSIVVGVLLLLFSVLFPLSKLIAMQVYLRGGQKIRRQRLVNFFAFQSGKWSMADVTVVSIFIAYIGFKGILTTQLAELNIKAEYVEIIATNDTALQPGFILFMAFVLFGFALSGILKKTASTS